MEEREHLMDRQRDLEETFKPVVPSNEKIARDIIKESEPITEGLYELNRNLEIKEKETSTDRKQTYDYGTLARSIYLKIYG